MKLAVALVLLLLAAIAGAGEALILIHPDRAEPIVAEENYLHGEWILWPPVDSPGSGNRVLSLLTGSDWAAPSNLFDLKQKQGVFIAGAFQELRRRGYFEARNEMVDRRSAVVETNQGLVSPNAMVLGLTDEGPGVRVLGFSDAWPDLVFAEAGNWDEVQAVVEKAGGRSLVIEYPPPDRKRWSRFWLRGPGWGSHLPTFKPWGVAGLIPASQSSNLLLHPGRFSWTRNNVGDWGGANRWITFIGYYAPLIFAVLMSLTVFFAGCAIYLVSREEPARFAGQVLKYFTLLPAAILISGRVAVAIGRSGYEFWLILAFALLVIGAQLLGGLFRRLVPRAHPMLAIGLVGLTAVLGSDPVWTLYSNVLGTHPLPVSPEAVGALGGYLTMVCGFARGIWLGRFLALAVLVWGLVASSWWVADEPILLLVPLVALVAGEGTFRIWELPVAAIAPLADLHVIRHGFAWSPGGLIQRYEEHLRLNLARHVEFLASPGFLLTAFVTGVVAVFVERFFLHELRRTLRTDKRTQSLFHAAALFAAIGILQPLLLYAALMCFVGGLLVLLSDTARTI